jgi:hypothetical protein
MVILTDIAGVPVSLLIPDGEGALAARVPFPPAGAAPIADGFVDAPPGVATPGEDGPPVALAAPPAAASPAQPTAPPAITVPAAPLPLPQAAAELIASKQAAALAEPPRGQEAPPPVVPGQTTLQPLVTGAALPGLLANALQTNPDQLPPYVPGQLPGTPDTALPRGAALATPGTSRFEAGVEPFAPGLQPSARYDLGLPAPPSLAEAQKQSEPEPGRPPAAGQPVLAQLYREPVAEGIRSETMFGPSVDPGVGSVAARPTEHREAGPALDGALRPGVAPAGAPESAGVGLVLPLITAWLDRRDELSLRDRQRRSRPHDPADGEHGEHGPGGRPADDGAIYEIRSAFAAIFGGWPTTVARGAVRVASHLLLGIFHALTWTAKGLFRRYQERRARRQK